MNYLAALVNCCWLYGHAPINGVCRYCGARA